MFTDELKKIVGEGYVFTGASIDAGYGRDQSLCPGRTFDALVRPGCAEEISAIVRLCGRHGIPLTPRGGGTGVTGGAIPAKGGVVLSCERLNRILSIDIENRYAIVESGVVTEIFCDALESRGMYFPVVPGSKGSSLIGGNLAMNSGSPRSCKYGLIGNHVLNLEVVLPTGEIMETGANVLKNAAGFNLTALFTGSEGTLGVITKAVLKISPLPASRRLLLAGYSGLAEACSVSQRLAASVVHPSAVELVTEDAIRMTIPHLPENFPLLTPDIRAHLLVELEANGGEDMEALTGVTAGILETGDPVDIVVGSTFQEREFLWALRGKIDVAMTSNGWSYRDIDTCIPPAGVFDYLERIGQISLAHRQKMISFGHIMDGNLHTMLLFRSRGADSGSPGTDDPGKVRAVVEEIYRAALQIGGTITGEHGIGLLQQEFLPLQFSPGELDLMRRLKLAFDPHLIMNPGKILLG